MSHGVGHRRTGCVRTWMTFSAFCSFATATSWLCTALLTAFAALCSLATALSSACAALFAA